MTIHAFRYSLVIAALAGCDPGSPELQVNVSALSIGDLRCAASETRTLVVTNVGDAVAELEASSTLAEIAVSPAAASIPPGGRQLIEVVASAPEAGIPGAISAGDVVLTAGGEPLAVPVSFRTTGVTVTADRSVDFGQLFPGTQATRMLAVTATGRGLVTIALGAAGSPFDVPTGSQVTLSPDPVDPGEPVATATHELPLRILASAEIGSFSAELPITVTGDVCGPPPATTLAAETTSDVVTFDRTSIDFGTVTCGNATSTELAIANHGDSAVMYRTTLTDPQSLIGLVMPPSGFVFPGQTGKVRVFLDGTTLSEVTPGLVLANLDVELGTVTRPVPVRAHVARAVLAPSTQVIELGDVPQGTTVTRTFSISNTGNLASIVSMFSPDGVGVSPFSFYVGPHGSARTVTLTITPQQPIGSPFELYVGANGTESCQPQQGVFVRGRVVAP